MATFLHGIPVTLYERTRTGADAFNAPVYSETPVTVENVLVSPVSAEAIVSDLQLYGKRAVYELCLPKGDTHDWAGVPGGVLRPELPGVRPGAGADRKPGPP